MRTIKTFLIPFVLFVLTISTAIVCQNRMIDKWRHTSSRFRDTLYLPSSDYVRVVSLGYNQFTADFLWLRMIQVFAASWSSAESPRQIWNYANIITDLDPRFIDPYRFAIMGIGEEGRSQAQIQESEHKTKNEYGEPWLKVGEIDNIIKGVVNKAILKNPGTWQVPYDGAFYSYYSMNDMPLARYYIRMAKMDPNYPLYIERWEGYFEMKQGRYRAAYEKFLGDYIGAIRSHNTESFGIYKMQLDRSLNAWFCEEIKQRALEWKKTHGQLPTVEELRKAGAFKDVELPEVSKVMGLLQDLIDNPEKTAKLSNDAINQFVTKTIEKWPDLPMGPYDLFDKRFQGFLIWPAKGEKDDKFVLSMLEAMHWTQEYVIESSGIAKSMKESSPDKKFPATLSYAEANITKTDPWGKPWLYDPNTGTVKSPTWPDIQKMQIPDVYERN